MHDKLLWQLHLLHQKKALRKLWNTFYFINTSSFPLITLGKFSWKKYAENPDHSLILLITFFAVLRVTLGHYTDLTQIVLGAT